LVCHYGPKATRGGAYDGIAEKGDGTLDAVFNGKMMFMHIEAEKLSL
jgi:hypothetical protein